MSNRKSGQAVLLTTPSADRFRRLPSSCHARGKPTIASSASPAHRRNPQRFHERSVHHGLVSQLPSMAQGSGTVCRSSARICTSRNQASSSSGVKLLQSRRFNRNGLHAARQYGGSLITCLTFERFRPAAVRQPGPVARLQPVLFREDKGKVPLVARARQDRLRSLRPRECSLS